MEDKLKVEGHTHLIRDLKSQAIINTDSSAYIVTWREKLNNQKKMMK